AELDSRLVRLLESLVADPEQLVGRVGVHLPDERAALVAAGNDSAVAVAPTNFAALFEAQVQRYADEPAVLADGVELSYAQLNERANRLARLLAAHGRGPERRLALALPRPVDLITARRPVL